MDLWSNKGYTAINKANDVRNVSTVHAYNVMEMIFRVSAHLGYLSGIKQNDTCDKKNEENVRLHKGFMCCCFF